MQTWIVLHVIVEVARLFHFFWEDRWMELILATIELYIKQLVDDVANVFTKARCESLRLDIASSLTAELFQVV